MSPKQKASLLEFVNAFDAMPESSKKKLTQNIDTNYAAVLALKQFYNKLIPSNYSVYIEFKPTDKRLNIGESIDFGYLKKMARAALKVVLKNGMSNCLLPNSTVY